MRISRILLGAALVCGLASCGGPPVKNPGSGSSFGSIWAGELQVDPAAEIGKNFWITISLNGAAGDVRDTSVKFILPQELKVVSGDIETSGIYFKMDDSLEQTVWVYAETLAQPVLITARVQGFSDHTQSTQEFNQSLYLILVENKITAASDIPVPNGQQHPLVPFDSLTVVPSPRIPREPNK